MLVASGTRADVLPMLWGGSGPVWITHVRRRLRAGSYLGLLGGATLAIVAGAVFFLGFGVGDSDGTYLLFLRPLNLAVAEFKGVYSPIVEILLAAGLPGR